MAYLQNSRGVSSIHPPCYTHHPVAASHGFGEEANYTIMGLAALCQNQLRGLIAMLIPLFTIAIVTLSVLQDGFCLPSVWLELSR